jgi:hypothetical protein
LILNYTDVSGAGIRLARQQANKGFTYRQVLEHYYPGSKIENMYAG